MHVVHNDGTRDTRHLHRTARMFVHEYIHTHKQSLFECSTPVSMCLPYVKGGHPPAPIPQCM